MRLQTKTVMTDARRLVLAFLADGCKHTERQIREGTRRHRQSTDLLMGMVLVGWVNRFEGPNQRVLWSISKTGLDIIG